MENWSNLFHPKPVKDHDKESLEATRICFAEAADQLQHLIPKGRYQAMVKSKLEEAAMLATKAFTHEAR